MEAPDSSKGQEGEQGENLIVGKWLQILVLVVFESHFHSLEIKCLLYMHTR